MYRLVKLGGKWYSKAINFEPDSEAEWEDVLEFIENGEIVVLCDDLTWAAEELRIQPEDITEV